MAPGIVQIKRTGSITHQVDGLRESLSLEYTVEVDSKTVALADIDNVTTAAWGWGGANPLPEPYVTYLSGSRGIIVCKTCRLTRKLEEPKHWRYAIEFNNEPLSQQEQEKLDEPVPILRPARVTRSSQMIAVPVERDLDANPLVNTAGQKPIDPLMLEAVHETLQVETYQPAWPIFYNTLSQKRSINSTSVVIKGQTFPAKSLWFWPAGIDAGTTENGTFFYTVRYDFVVRLETWTMHVERLSNGYEQLIETPPSSGTFKLVKIKLPNGEEPRSPMLLSASGVCPFPQESTVPYYQSSNVFEEVNFNTAFAGAKLPGID